MDHPFQPVPVKPPSSFSGQREKGANVDRRRLQL
jgi:hypothetical protein